MIQNKYILDLQFFNAESEGRTEKATSKKREDTRKKGQVAKSQELNTAVMIMSFCFMMVILGGYMMSGIENLFKVKFNLIGEIVLQEGLTSILEIFKDTSIDLLLICLPLWLALFVLAFLICYIQVKFKVSFEPMKPKFSKLNPVGGFKRLFSKDSLISLFLSIGKVVILGSIIYQLIASKIPLFIKFYDMPIRQSFSIVVQNILFMGFFVGGAFLFLAVLDYIYQYYKHEDSIKMTKQEVKDEYKNSEGDPKVKGKIRQKMREASMRRMMQAIPEADVIITNPTHFAVAIKYDEDKNGAPIVVAKGVDYLAQKIKEKAREFHIEIVENKPLARALYYSVDINREIPPELYGAVAEVLAFVYNLQNKQMNRRK